MDTVLLVDDDPLMLDAINQCLQGAYRTRIATRGVEAIERARQHPRPDLILLDIELPDLHGFEVCARLKKDGDCARIPVIFLSGRSGTHDVARGFEIGAADFVAKPVAPAILLARIRTQLRLRDAQRQLAERNLHLESLIFERTRDLEQRTEDLLRNQELTVVALGSIAETRDNETGNHIQRTSTYIKVLIENLLDQPQNWNLLPLDEWALVWKCSPLHDIGKVGIPDQILLKPGRLDEREFTIMKQHTTLGRQALATAQARAGMESAFLRVATEIAYSHHERWDGSGYPEGLAGNAIPLSARMMAVADVYDALISRRVYKEAMAADVAADIIREGRGKQFDPAIVDCFLECREAIEAVADRLSDNPTPEPQPT